MTGRVRTLLLWVAFLIVHGLLAAVNLADQRLALTDVTVVYRFWVDRGLEDGYWVGLDGPWVYPILALVPMLISTVLGSAGTALAWLLLITGLNAVALAFLLRICGGSSGVRAACWWLVFLLLLGPISVTRIDAVTVPLAVVALLLLRRHPNATGVLLAVGAWMKVWPGALLLAVVVAARSRWSVLAAAAGLSGIVVLVALALGSGTNVLSFLTLQSSRGLQIEAPAAAPFMWASVMTGTSTIYYDQPMLTYQLSDPATQPVSAMLTPLLALAVAAILALGIRALRAGADRSRLLVLLAFATIAAMLVLNKVGSPQLATWLAVPILIGLAGSEWRRYVFPGVLGWGIAALTQLVYPVLYGWLIAMNPAVLAILTTRNALYLVLLVWSLVALARLGSPARDFEQRGHGRGISDPVPMGTQ